MKPLVMRRECTLPAVRQADLDLDKAMLGSWFLYNCECGKEHRLAPERMTVSFGVMGKDDFLELARLKELVKLLKPVVQAAKEVVSIPPGCYCQPNLPICAVCHHHMVDLARALVLAKEIP